MNYLLRAEDEYPHPPSAEPHFNESVYVNAFDWKSGIGGWTRIGNRVNEGRAEVAVCLYLPDGRIACQFLRPAITNNEHFDAAGLRYVVDTPLAAVTMTYRGELLLVDDPQLFRNPKKLFTESARVDGEFAWRCVGISPVHGGVPKDPADETMYGREFSLGHLYQHLAVSGEISIGGALHEFQGYGWRDHSWGPRHWQNIRFHRLLTGVFDRDHAFVVLKVANTRASVRRYGMVLDAGQYDPVLDFDLLSDWSEQQEPRRHRLRIRTTRQTLEIDGEVTSVAPLRNRRVEAGRELAIQIAEGYTRWRCGSRTGFGMTEFGDRIEDHGLAGYPL